MSEHILYRNLAELKLWNRNYREGDVGAIITSIARFGYNGALRVWTDDVVIAGNHALMALKQMKAGAYQTPRGIVERDGAWFVPCVDVTHLNSVEAEAFAIADNHTQELGSTDPQQLAALLTDIAAEDDDLLQSTGYGGDDVDDLLNMLSAPSLDDLANEFGESDGSEFDPVIRIQVPPHVFAVYQSLMDHAPGETDAQKIEHILEAVDVAVLSSRLS